VQGQNDYKLTIQHLILSLSPNRLPCDAMLLYKTPYPCVKVGRSFVDDDADTFDLHFASVILHDSENASLTIFNANSNDVLRTTKHDTAEIFDVLRKEKLLVLPMVARPSALVYVADEGFYGTLIYDKELRTCFNPITAQYTCRYFHNDMVKEKFFSALDIMDVLVQEREKIYIRTEALLALPIIATLLPVGSENTYMMVKAWYPEDESAFEEDHICVLIRRGTSDR
jgi:hypothetical protein